MTAGPEPLPTRPDLLEHSFTSVFAEALRGQPCRVVGVDGEIVDLPVSDWTRAADEADDVLLSHCYGPTLDAGCGPGRLTARLAELGHVALGVDVVPEAVRQTRRRGVSAVHRNLLRQALPGEGRWQTVLLADGNVGIGGDPVALLDRCRTLLDPRGRIVVEVAAPQTCSLRGHASLEIGGRRSRPFPWATLSIDDVDDVAASLDLRVSARAPFGDGRRLAVLEEPL